MFARDACSKMGMAVGEDPCWRPRGFTFASGGRARFGAVSRAGAMQQLRDVDRVRPSGGMLGHTLPDSLGRASRLFAHGIGPLRAGAGVAFDLGQIFRSPDEIERA